MLMVTSCGKSFPEVVLFIGAGATAQLGMPQTDLQTKILRALASHNPSDSLEDILADSRPKKIFGMTPAFEGRNLEIMAAFIRFLGDDLEKDWNLVDGADLRNGRAVFGESADEGILRSRILELRREYDWNALKRIIQVCPHDEVEDNLVRDVYTMIDMKLRDKQGIKVKSLSGEVEIIEPERLPKARNCLVLFTNILFANAWYGLSRGKRAEQFQKYVRFMESLAHLMQKEGVRFADETENLQSAEFY